MYAKNITTFLLNMVKDKQLQINTEDEIIRDTLICRDGQVVNPRIQQLLASPDRLKAMPWPSRTPDAAEPESEPRYTQPNDVI